MIEWLHFSRDFMCISKAYLSSKLLTLVWQQISSLYNSSFCAMIDLNLRLFDCFYNEMENQNPPKSTSLCN